MRRRREVTRGRKSLRPRYYSGVRTRVKGGSERSERWRNALDSGTQQRAATETAQDLRRSWLRRFVRHPIAVGGDALTTRPETIAFPAHGNPWGGYPASRAQRRS